MAVTSTPAGQSITKYEVKPVGTGARCVRLRNVASAMVEKYGVSVMPG